MCGYSTSDKLRTAVVMMIMVMIVVMKRMMRMTVSWKRWRCRRRWTSLGECGSR